VNFVPYGGPVYKPPLKPVGPPSPRERKSHLRMWLLIILFLLASYLLLVGFGEDGYSGPGLFTLYPHYIASGATFVLWYVVKRLWKTE
jgi:uncharacterized RDD family membrane protein YckC